MTPRFKKLKGEMYANDFTQADVADFLGKSTSYVASRFTGKMPWTMDDVYAICGLLEIPDEQITEYFPRCSKGA